MRSTALKQLSVLLLALLVGACSSSSKKELKPMALQDFDTALHVKKTWSRSIGALGEFYHQFELAVDAQYLYSAAREGSVYQLDKFTGARRWKVSLELGIAAGVAIDSQRVYVAAQDGAVIALAKADGQQLWSTALPSEAVSAPTVSGDNLIIQLSNGQVYNLNTSNGEKRWQYDSHVPSLTIRGTGKAAVFGQFVAVGLANGKLAILDVNTGQLRWENRVGIAKGDTEIERIVDVDTTPALVQDKLFTVSYQGRIVAYDLSNGRTLWAEDESSYHDLSIGFGNVYAVSDDGLLTAYDQQSGKIKWQQEDLQRRTLTAPTAVSSYIVVADYDGYFHVISQVDGSILARKRVDVSALKCFCSANRQANLWRLIKESSGVRSAILADGNRFYAVANNGRLRAYEIGTEIKNAGDFVEIPYRHFKKSAIKKIPSE